MIELTKDNFDQEVTNAEGLVFVDFWGEKCEPCMAIMPEVVAFAEKNAGRAKFCKLNTAGNRRLAIAQKVMGIPTFIFYKGGEKLYTFDTAEIEEGGMPAVQAKLDELLA